MPNDAEQIRSSPCWSEKCMEGFPVIGRGYASDEEGEEMEPGARAESPSLNAREPCAADVWDNGLFSMVV